MEHKPRARGCLSLPSFSISVCVRRPWQRVLQTRRRIIIFETAAKTLERKRGAVSTPPRRQNVPFKFFFFFSLFFSFQSCAHGPFRRPACWAVFYFGGSYTVQAGALSSPAHAHSVTANPGVMLAAQQTQRGFFGHAC